MSSPAVNYRSLNERNPFIERNDSIELDTSNENEDTPRNSGVMIHIVPETSKARWNHIEDLDSFFTRMYNYHQKHGFTVILMDEIFQICEFAFVVWLLTFTVHCIRHSVLFGDTPPEGNHTNTKVTLGDVLIPMGQCTKNFNGFTYIILFMASLYLLVRFVKLFFHISQYLDIKKFYNLALHIKDNELDNITWHEVKKKLREVQAEQHMCIDKEQLTELDIYHRILRFKNYMVALMNKNLLPVRFTVPGVGEVVSLSRGLLFNIDFILFRGPGSPFQNNWQLRDDYTIRSNHVELAQRLSNLIMWVAIANFLLAPIIFVWQIIYFSFAYANVLRKEPGALGIRTWSNYGRLYLRHFNELDHELDARLNRAYEYSDKYLSSFSSPLMSVIAKNLLFISGGVLILILGLGIYEEFVFQVEHVLSIITVLSAIGLVCRTLIPDENLIWCPEQLMTAVLAHVHYLPTEWKNKAHTATVRAEFENFFQLKAGYLLNEICSPLITPFLLIFVFRPKALELVKFFRSFTVTVKGVGNVCSFAQMDVRRHGNADWQSNTNTEENTQFDFKKSDSAENGKTELSLLRFTLTNPDWQMPQEASNFIRGLRIKAINDLKATKRTCTNASNPITESLLSFGTIGEEFSAIANSVLMADIVPSNLNHSLYQSSNLRNAASINQEMLAREHGFEHMLQQNLGDPAREALSVDNMASTSQRMGFSLGPFSNSTNKRKMRVWKTEGRLEGPSDALIYSIYDVDPTLANKLFDVTVADMCLSTLYLHELHKQNIKSKRTTVIEAVTEPHKEAQIVVTSKAVEDTPLLGNSRI